MQEVIIAKSIIEKLPNIRLGCLQCSVQTEPSNENILSLADGIFSKIIAALDESLISQKPAIKETKEAYRKLGKDPSRYRPSAEALTRRIVKGKDLFWINNIVDILNLISLESGFSIGGYDADKIKGKVEFGIGKTDEPYEAIGRGSFNIENLPVFRDDRGAFGSPTSDSTKTMVTDQTTNFLMVIIDFARNKKLKETIERSSALYRQYAKVADLQTKIVKG
jgi:DNA/RNA-binding domain of Phe-tRNA-synthetase-like protein